MYVGRCSKIIKKQEGIIIMEIKDGSVIYPVPGDNLLSEKENGDLNYLIPIESLLKRITELFL